MKNTKSRTLILNCIKESDKPLSAEDIFKAELVNGTNLSTIYRTLLTFTKDGLIKKELAANGVYYYTIQKSEHKHILECSCCHTQIELDECPFDQVQEEIKDKLGFEINDANTIIYGKCKNCK